MKRTLLVTGHRGRRARRRAGRVGRGRSHRRLDDAQARPRHGRCARRPRRVRRPVGRARAGTGGVRFPITGGRIDARTAAGTIRHAGGLRFSAGGRSLTLRAPRVAVGRKIMLSARVGGGRVHLLELTGARVSRSGFNTNVSGLRARLTQKAASALNATFGVKAFKKGLRLGTASVRSRTDEADILARSATSLEIDPGRCRR